MKTIFTFSYKSSAVLQTISDCLSNTRPGLSNFSEWHHGISEGQKKRYLHDYVVSVSRSLYLAECIPVYRTISNHVPLQNWSGYYIY